MLLLSIYVILTLYSLVALIYASYLYYWYYKLLNYTIDKKFKHSDEALGQLGGLRDYVHSRASLYNISAYLIILVMSFEVALFWPVNTMKALYRWW